LEGYQAVPGNVKPGVISWEEASKLDHLALLREGFTDVQVANWPESLELSKLAVLLIRPRPNPASPGSSTAINLGSGGSILLQKDGKQAIIKTLMTVKEMMIIRKLPKNPQPHSRSNRCKEKSDSGAKMFSRFFCHWSTPLF
jgi:hypothetical protein